MALYLVQHGKSLPKEVDPDRGLSEEGIKEVEIISGIARDHDVVVAGIKHSGKKRAKQTAEIFASVLKPKLGILQMNGLDPLDDVTVVAENINSEDNVMLVGHLPFMKRLTSYLITGTIDTPVFKFQNGGIVCLDKDTGLESWTIRWALMPHVGQK